RQYDRHQMVGVGLLAIDGRQSFRLAAASRDPMDAVEREHDRAVVRKPAGTKRQRGLADFDGRSAVAWDLAQCPTRPESNPLAVVRDEWRVCALGVGDRLRHIL